MSPMRVCFILACLGASAAVSAAGPNAQKYCNDMYPPDSYEAEERQFFVNACLESYGDEIEEEAAAAPEGGDGYYDGSVEEFVDSLPVDDGTDY